MPVGDDYLNQFNQSLLKQPAPAQLDPTKMNAVLQALGTNLMKPVDAAQNIMGQGDRSPSNMTIDPGKSAFMAGPMAMMPMFNQAPAGSVGITASRLMQRPDVMKMVKDGRAKGMLEPEIAKSINERFAPILDYGQSVRHGQVSNIAEKLRQQEVMANRMAGKDIGPGLEGKPISMYKQPTQSTNPGGLSAIDLSTGKANLQNLRDLEIWQKALPMAQGGRKAFVEQKIKELQDKINGR
jgi:hypothetical protein